jgi:hypothetical protein
LSINTWDSISSTDGNLGTNYTLGTLSSTDDIVFDGTSVINCTLTGTLSCNSFTITSGYTGTFNDGGYAVAIVSTVSITPGGTFTSSGTWTQSGDADFILANAGTYSVTSMRIILQGTGNFALAKAGTNIAKLTCADTGKTTTLTSNCGCIGSLSSMLVGGSGNLVFGSYTFNIYCNATCTPYSLASTTITGSSPGKLYITTNNLGTAPVITISAITMSGGMGLYTVSGGASSGGISFSYSGAVDTGTGDLRAFINQLGNIISYATNNYSISCGALIIGTTVNATVYWYFGSSTVTCASFDCGNTYNNGSANYFSASGTWTIAGGVYWYGGNGGTGTPSFTVSGTWTQTGNGNFNLVNNPGNFSIASMQIVLQGTGVFTLGKPGVYFSSLSCAYTGKTTTIGAMGAGSGISSGTSGMLTTNGGTYTQNSAVGMTLFVTGTCTPMSLSGSIASTATNTIYIAYIGNGTDTITVPPITITGGTGGLAFGPTTAGTGVVTYNLTGALSCTGSVYMYAATGTGGTGHIFNTNDYSLTCTGLFVGSQVVSKTITCNFGASTIICSSFDGGVTYNSAAVTLSSSGSWTVSGVFNWTPAASSSFTASGTITQTADANFTLSNIGTSSTASLHVINQGNSTVTIQPTIGFWDFAYTGKGITINGAIVLSGSTDLFCAAHGGSLSLGTGTGLAIYVTGSCTPYNLSNLTSIAAPVGSHFIYIYVGVNSITPTNVTLGGMSIGNYSNVGIIFSGSSYTVATMSGSISTSYGNIYVYLNSSTAAATGNTFNTTYGLYATSYIYFGSANAGKDIQYNLTGGGYFSNGVQTIESTTYNAGTCTVNCNSTGTHFSCGGNLSIGSNTTLAGTPNVYFSGINNKTFSSNGKIFNTVTVNCSGYGVFLSNALSCHSVNVTAGVFGIGSYTVTWDTMFTTSVGITFNASYIGTSFTLNANCTFTTAFAFTRLNCDGQTITFQASTVYSLSSYTQRDWDLTTFVSSSPGTQYQMNSSVSGILATSVNWTDLDASGGSILYAKGTLSNTINVNSGSARTWSSSGSTNGNLATNYTGAGIITPADDITFNNTSVVNCTLTGTLTVYSLTISSNYTGTFNDGGFSPTIHTTVSITPGGTFTATGTWTQWYDYNFTLAASGTYNVLSMNITLQGTGTYSVAQNNTIIRTLTCSASGKTTTIGTSGTSAGVTYLVMGTGTLTVNNIFRIMIPVGVSNAITLSASYTINGTSTLAIHGYGSTAFNVPAITTGGTTVLQIDNYFTSSTATITQTGNISAYGLNIISAQTSANFVFNAGTGMSITATSTFNMGGGNTAGYGTGTFNFSNSTVIAYGVNTSTYSTTVCNINFQTSIWTCRGNWVYAANTVIDNPLTLTFNVASASITSAGHLFQNVTINGSTFTYTIADTFSCNNLSCTAGSLTFNNKAITIAGNLTWNSSGTFTMYGAISFTGNATVTLYNAGTLTSTETSRYTMSFANNTTSTLTVYYYTPIMGAITVGSSASLTLTSSMPSNQGLYISALGSNSGVITIGNGSTLTANVSGGTGNITLRGIAGYSFINFQGTHTFNGNSSFIFNPYTNAGTHYIPATTYTGTGTGFTVFIVWAGGVTVSLTGAVNFGSAAFSVQGWSSSSGNATFNTQNNTLTCGNLSLGHLTAGLSITLNLGTSIVNCGSISQVTTVGLSNLNLSSGSTLNISGGVNLSVTNFTLTDSGATWNFITTGSISLPGIPIKAAVINSAGNTYTLTAALSCSTFTITAGIFNQNSYALTTSGNISCGGSDALTLNAAITMTGNGTFLINTAGSVTFTPMVVTLQGNTTINIGNRTLSELILAYTKTYTFTASSILTINTFNNMDWDNTTWVSSSPGTRYNINAPSGVLLQGISITDADASGSGSTIYAKGTGSNDVNITFGATRTWNSSGSTDGNLATNYTGSGSILPVDDVIFDNTSVGNCTFTGTLTAATLTIAATYTGTFNDGGYAFTVLGSVSITPGGTFTASGTWTQSHDGNWTYANQGTYSVLSQLIILQGTGTLLFAKAGTNELTGNINVLGLTCAAVGKTTTVSASSGIYSGCQNLTLGGGIFTLSGAFQINPLAGGVPITQNGSTITGSATIMLSIKCLGAWTVTVPALTTSGIRVFFQHSTGATIAGVIELSGAQVHTGQDCTIATYSVTGTTNFNTNNYSMTFGTNFQVGSATATNTFNMNLGSSTITCTTFNASTYVTGPTVLASTGNWTIGGAFNWTTHASSQFNCSGTFTQTADGNFTLANTGTYSVTSMQAILQGTGTLSFAAASTAIAKLTCSAATKTTTIGAMGAGSGVKSNLSNMLTTGTGTLQLQGNALALICTDAITPYSISGTVTATSTGVLDIKALLSVDGTITIPATTVASFGGLTLTTYTGCAGNVTFSISGTITVGGIFNVYVDTGTVGTAHIFNTNNFSISHGATSNQYFSIGSKVSGKSITYNWGSTAFSTGGLSDATTFKTGTFIMNLSTCTWSCFLSFVITSGGTWNVGTSVFTMSATISGMSVNFFMTLYDMVFSGASAKTLLGSISCHSLTCSAGAFTQNGFTVNLSGNFLWNSSGTWTITSATMNLTSDGNFSINNLGTLTFTTFNLTLQGTGNYSNLHANQIVLNLTCAYSGKTTTFTGSGSAAVGLCTFNGGNAVFNANLLCRPSAANWLTIGSSTLTGDGSHGFYMFQASGGWNIPAINAPTVLFTNFTSNASGAFTCTGNLTLKSINYGSDANTIGNTINFGNGFTHTFTGALSFYASGSLNTSSITVAMGTSTISAGSLVFTSATGSTTLNWGSGNKSFAGNITLLAGTTVTQGTANITITSTSTITTQGKSFPNMIINAPGSTVTQTGNLTCLSLNLQAATAYSFGANTITAANSITNSIPLTYSSSVVCTATITMNANSSITNTRSINRLIITAGTITITAGVTITAVTYTLGDWVGCILVSSSPGNRYNLNTPVKGQFKNATITDCNGTGARITARNNCINGGNNVNVAFINGMMALQAVTSL